jgi:hypothetical protein
MTRMLFLLCAVAPVLFCAAQKPATFVAKSVTHTATIHLQGSLGRVFPLFGPIREKDWAPGWEPQIVHPIGPQVAEGMVFTVDGGKDGTAYWIITRYDEATHRIAYANVIPGYLFNRIEIECRAAGADQTDVTVTYQHTALNDAGNEFVATIDDAMYAKKMAHWQHAIDHLLTTGHRITSH